MYVLSQYAHDVVLTSMRRRFNVMDVVWTSKRRRVFTDKTIRLDQTNIIRDNKELQIPLNRSFFLKNKALNRRGTSYKD